MMKTTMSKSMFFKSFVTHQEIFALNLLHDMVILQMEQKISKVAKW